jgi:hypothetical protein
MAGSGAMTGGWTASARTAHGRTVHGRTTQGWTTHGWMTRYSRAATRHGPLWPLHVPTLVVALLLAVSTLVTAQTPTDSARAAATADSLRRATEGSAAPAAPGTPTAPGAPTADRVPPALGPGSTQTDPATIPLGVGPADPTDTTLARACAGEPAGSEAPGLLAVIFNPGTSERDRAAAAKAVGGTLAGSSPYGEDYVRLAVGAGPLTAVADQLIRQNPVKQVSPAACPAAPVTPSGAVAPSGDSISGGGGGAAGGVTNLPPAGSATPADSARRAGQSP